MPGRILRVVIDTNLWLSFLISNNFSKIQKILVSNKVELLLSEELESELLDVASRSKFRRYFSYDNVQIALTIFREYTTPIKVKTVETVCRDPKDNFLLALAVDGNADFIITGDADLLILENHKGTKITTIAKFLETF